MPEQAEDIVAKARAIIRKEAPYLMSAVFGLIPEYTNSVKTMATSARMVMHMNPKWVEKHTAYNIAAVIVHEVSHVLRKHHKRFEHLKDATDLQIANIAMDIAINPDLRDGGWDLPGCALYPAKFKLKEGLSAEEYYNLLKKQHEDGSLKLPQQGASLAISGGQGEGDSPGSGDSPGEDVTAGSCGGCSTGNDDSEEKEDREIGRTEPEIEGILQKAAFDIKEWQQNPGRGSMPGFFKEMANFILEPKKVDWRVVMASVVRRVTGKITSGGMDLSLRRPSKRSYTRGILRPGLIQKTPEIAIIRDTSGSMGMDQLKQATSEACHIIQMTGVDTVWFFDADTKGSNPERVTLNKLLSLPIYGRGGTDFINPLKQASELVPRPDVIIYMTDGDGHAPPKAPDGIEVIWCIVSSYYNKAPAEWGHHVFLGEKR